MDPLTITCTVGAIARTVFNISQTLHKFIKDTKGVNQSVKDLAAEVSGLSTALRAVQSGLNDPAIRRAELKAEKTDSLELWRSVHGSLLNTRATVDKLDEALEDIRAEKTNFAKQAVRQFRLNLKTEEITGLRAQFRTHIGALQMTLLMMNVRATCMTSEVSAELGPKIEALGGMIDGLKVSIDNSRKQSDGADVPQLIFAKHSERLTKSAQKILSSASTMYSQSEYGGSVFGEVLDDFTRQRMHEWIPPAPLIEETASDIASADQLSPKEDSIFSDPERLTASHTEDTELLSPIGEDDDTGGEFEFEVVERFLSSGAKAFEQSDYKEATALIEAGHALVENLTFQQRQQLDLRGSQLTLAKCSYHSGDLDHAEVHLNTYAENFPPTLEDAVAIQACHASHLLAQVCLKKGKPTVARAHCKKALIGRRRILGKEDTSYYESLFLLAEICETSNAASEAKVYMDMIPVAVREVLPRVGPLQSAQRPNIQTPRINEPPTINAKQALRSSVVFDFDSLEPQPEYMSEVSTPSIGLAPGLERAFSSNNPFRRKSVDDRPVVLRTQTSAGGGLRVQSRTQSPASGVHRVKSTGAIVPGPAVAVSNAPADGATTEQSLQQSTDPDKIDWSLLWRFVAKLDEQYIPSEIQKGASKYVTSAILRNASLDTLRKLAAALSNGPAPMISPLHLAICINHAQLVRLFIEDQTHAVNERCPYYTNDQPAMKAGNTPMHCAAQYGRVELVRLLLGMGADIFLKNESQHTPLHVAVAFGHIDVVNELTRATSVPFVSGEESPLHVAAKHNRSAILQVLLDRQAPLEVFDSDGRTPLHIAVYNNSFACVEELLQRGADVESTSGVESMTPLHIGTRKGHVNVIQELVNFNAQVDAKTASGETALHISVRHRQPHAFRTLLGRGADIDAQDNSGMTVMRIAVDDRQRATIDLLIQRRASLELADVATSRRPLHAAVLTANIDIVRALVDAGANPTATDISGRSPQDLARSMNYTEIEQLLSLVRSRQMMEEQPGLEVVEVQPGLEVAYHQPQAFPPPQSMPGFHPASYGLPAGWTPLHRAAYFGYKDEILALVHKGSNPLKKTSDGQTARDLAAMQGHVAIEALLQGLELRSPTIAKRFSRLFGQ